MLKRCLFLIGLLIFSLPVVGYADEASHRAAAKEFFELTKIPEIANATMRESINSALMQVPNREKYQDIVDDVISKYISFEKVEDQYITYHMQLFSEQELRDLIAFCKTPTGQKYIRASPELNQYMTQLMVPLVQNAMQELSTRMSERSKEIYEKDQKGKP